MPELVLYGIRLLAKQILGTILDIEVDQSVGNIIDCYYLHLIQGTADFLPLPLRLVLADLSVQLVCQLRVVLGLVTVGSFRSELSITNLMSLSYSLMSWHTKTQ